jgi:hypothetical protein
VRGQKHPRNVGYRLTNTPTSRRLNRRLTAVFLRLRYRSGRPPYQEGPPNRQSAGAIAASPSVHAWLRPPLTAPGDWWATTTNGLVRRAATARSYKRSCARLVPEPENYRLPVEPAKPMRLVSKRREQRSPPEGSCPLQAGEAFLKMPRLLQPPLRAGPIVSAVVRVQARETGNGVLCDFRRRKQCACISARLTWRNRRQKGTGSHAY